jgi:hypothetical protein
LYYRPQDFIKSGQGAKKQYEGGLIWKIKQQLRILFYPFCNKTVLTAYAVKTDTAIRAGAAFTVNSWRYNMQFSAFTAQCPYEIGDRIKDVSGNVLTITDIAAFHSLKNQSVEFLYEFDNSGKYKKIAPVPVSGMWKR